MRATEQTAEPVGTTPNARTAGSATSAREVIAALRVMTPHMLAHGRPLLAAVIACTLSRVGATGVAGLGAYLVGATVAGTRPEPILAWTAALVALALGVGIARWLENWWSHVYAFRIVAELRLEVFRTINRLSPAYLMRRPSSEAATLIMSEAERLEWLYAHIVPLTFATFIASGAGITALWIIDPGLGLVLLAAALLLLVIPVAAGRLARRQGSALRERITAMHRIVTDGIQGMRDVLASGGFTGYARRIREADQALLGSKLAYGRRTGIEAAGSDLVQAAAVIGVVALAAGLITTDRIPADAVPFVIVLAGAVLGPLAMFVANSLQLGEVFGCAVRVAEVLTAPALITAPADPTPVDLSGTETVGTDLGTDQDLDGTVDLGPGEELVRVEDVHFAYPGSRREVLAGVSFTLRRGETLAITGASGSGKSTCAALLVRFFDPDSGSIRLGGTDLRELDPAELRRTVGLVTQETFLFHGSLRDNLRLGDPTAGDASLLAAAHMAHLGGLLDRLPEGLDTILDENGSSLSGGERQRIAIARALLLEPEVLILDEATTGLDPDTDTALRTALAETADQRATLFISHRRSTIASADRIIVIDDHRIVESGTPEVLLGRRGRLGELLDPEPTQTRVLTVGEGPTESETET